MEFAIYGRGNRRGSGIDKFLCNADYKRQARATLERNHSGSGSWVSRSSACVRRTRSSASVRSAGSSRTRPDPAMCSAVAASASAAFRAFVSAVSPLVAQCSTGVASLARPMRIRKTTAASVARPGYPAKMRPYRPGDPVRAHIAAIYEEFGLVFDPAFEDDLDDIAASYTPGAFWVVDDAEGLVATAAVVPYGAARLIKRIYVAPRGRRTGLARRLLRQCASWGDFARTELWSDVRFRAAHRLYLDEGFIPGPVRVLADPDASVERYFSR